MALKASGGAEQRQAVVCPSHPAADRIPSSHCFISLAASSDAETLLPKCQVREKRAGG